MKLVVFDIWGDYAHFRKFYTTTSPLTFAFPPPPTIFGMLGAIIGVDKGEYLRVFNSSTTNIAVRLLKPVKKIRMGVNLVNTKGNFWQLVERREGARTPIRFELLKDPAYRLYVGHSEPAVMERLVDFLENHRSFFTLSLGLSELLAGFKFVAVLEGEEKKMEKRDFSTILPLRKIPLRNFFIEGERKYMKERIPISLREDRIVDLFDDVLYEAEGRSLSAAPTSYILLENNEPICFL